MEELSKKTLAELRQIAKELDIKSVTKYKKNELVELINNSPKDNTNEEDKSMLHNNKENVEARVQKQGR